MNKKNYVPHVSLSSKSDTQLNHISEGSVKHPIRTLDMLSHNFLDITQAAQKMKHVRI